MPEFDRQSPKVPRRILTSLLASVSAGVGPRAGAPYIAIGRTDEIAALLGDLEAVNEGSGSMRFLIGRYGIDKELALKDSENLINAWVEAGIAE